MNKMRLYTNEHKFVNFIKIRKYAKFGYRLHDYKFKNANHPITLVLNIPDFLVR